MENVQIASRIWCVKGNRAYLGAGRIRLMKLIAQTGSIRKASSHMGMSYKRAWQLIEAINSLSAEPLIVSSTGGSGGGGSTITPKGFQVIETYEQLVLRCNELIEAEFRKCEL